MSEPGRHRLGRMVENWPWLRKFVLLLITALVALVANAVTGGILVAIGMSVPPSINILSGVMAFLASLPMLWMARPRGRRHLMILAIGTFAATAVTLLGAALFSLHYAPDPTDFQRWKGLGMLLFVGALGVWGLLYLLSRREEIWTLNRNRN